MTNSVLQKLQEASDKPKTKKCKYALIFEKLEPETQDFITERISLPTRHPNKISYATLTRVLRSEKHTIGHSTIGDHYNKVCACYSQTEDSI
jgi:hypothetical protein